LDVLTQEQLKDSELGIDAVIRGVLAAFRGDTTFDYRFSYLLNEVTTDVGIIPTRGGGWNCCGERALHEHTWDASTAYLERVYSGNSKIIGRANFALEAIPENDVTKSRRAEVIFLRALAYHAMIDQYGNVPIVTNSQQDPANLVGNMPVEEQRTKVFNFIEAEYLKAIEDLPLENEYTRPHKAMAQAFLAKLYLNAEVYTGTARWNDCIKQTNSVIDSNVYVLEDSVSDSFTTTNEQSKEIIFSIPQTAVEGEGIIANQVQLQPELAFKFRLPIPGWGGFSIMKQHYDSYDEDDKRREFILYGPQFVDDAKTVPLNIGATVKTNTTEFANGTGDQLVIQEITDFLDAPSEQGLKTIKYEPDVNADGRNSGNDVVVMRYSEVLLMKAEAILRGGTDPKGENAEILLNNVRKRNFTIEERILNPTLEDILNERNWEFSYEGSRRTDLIRFGRFASLDYNFKVNKDSHRSLFPIPQSELDKNPNLSQNPGY